MSNKKEKEFYFFKHASELHKKDLKFLIKYKSEGIGIYYLTLEHIVLGQFKHNRDEILNSMELFADEAYFNEVIDYLINEGILYTNNDDSLQSIVLDAEVHKKQAERSKGKATGNMPHIMRTIEDKGVDALIEYYKAHLTDSNIKDIKDTAEHVDTSDTVRFKKWAKQINVIIAQNKQSKN